jgi:predicted nucleic acid-binding protein
MTIVGQPLLLADTGPFCRFAEVGDGHLDAFAAHTRANLAIVQDVKLELHRLAQNDFPRLKQLDWIGFPAKEPITVTDKHLLAQIENICDGRRRRNPGHFMEDRGEVASILLAKSLGCPVLIDERWGREQFAVVKRVVTYTTEDLALELAVDGGLTEDQAFAVFRGVYRSTRSDFNARLAALRSL